MNGRKLIDFIDQHVPGLFFIIFVFAIIEIGILMVCVGYSGNHHILKIYDVNHQLIYEDVYDESHINEFKAVSGIKDFKNEGYTLTRSAIDNKFPTRAWISLSVCVPLVLILIFAFIVRVFTDLFHPETEIDHEHKKNRPYPDFEETRFEKIFSTLGRLNIYSLGVTAIVIGFFVWMIPDLIRYFGKISYQTVLEFKWVFLGLIIFLGAFAILKTVLSYKTQTEMIRQQAEIQKNRDRLFIEARLENKLPELENRSGPPRVLDFNRESKPKFQ